MTEEEIEATREKYIAAVKPVFQPDDPVGQARRNRRAAMLAVLTR